MTITERTRHDLHLRLDSVLGAEEATTLMEHLPPVGWADVATKTDLAQLEERIDARFETKLHREMNAQTKALFVANIANVAAIGSLVLAAAKL